MRDARWLLPLFIVLFFLQGLGSFWDKAPTYDEVLFVPAGYAFLTTGSVIANPEAQPLPRILSAIPLLLLNIEPPVEEELPAFRERYHWAADFLFGKNAAHAVAMISAARVSNLLLGCLLLILIYRWSYVIFGAGPALLSLAFASFEPNLIAHASLANSDMPFTFFFVATLYLFCTGDRTNRRLILTGLILGAAVLSKTSSWLLLPTILLILIGEVLLGGSRDFLKNAARSIVIPFAVMLLVINVAFLFQGTFLDKKEFFDVLMKGQQPSFLIRALVLFLPDDYAFPFLYNLAESMGKQHPFPFFLNGQYSREGFWYYFLEALALKTQVPVLLLAILSSVLLLKRKPARETPYLLLPWLFLLLYFSFWNKLNLGLRHILPVYAFWLVTLGAVAAYWRGSIRIAIVGLLLWSAGSAFWIFPYHLAYFNELAGGPSNGYKFLVDSNLDWGQDLIRLKRYVDNHKIDQVRLSYFGTADPGFYKIPYEYLPSPRFQPWTLKHPGHQNVDLKTGIYAISATNLQGVYLPDPNLYGFFRNRKPDDMIGYSILIYKVQP